MKHSGKDVGFGTLASNHSGKTEAGYANTAGNEHAPKKALPKTKNHPANHKLQHVDYDSMTTNGTEPY